MKRMLVLVCILSIFLSGCGIFGERIQQPVTFYYIAEEYQQTMCDVIVSEEREAAGHMDDLTYMLALYLMGPTEEAHCSPIPRGTNIFRAEITDSGVSLLLSDTEKTMSDAQFTLASTCLALTCMDITGLESVTVTSGTRSNVITADNLIIFDDPAANIMEEAS